MRRKIVTTLVAGLTIVVSGCAPAADPHPSSEPSPAPTSAPILAPKGHGTPPAEDSHGEPLAEVPDASPTHDSASDAAAIETATAAMNAYLRPDLNQRAWLEGLAPYFDAAAVTNLGSVDPASIPRASLTGPVTLGREQSGYLARAIVPTSAGDYNLLLARSNTAGAWLVARIDAPGVST